MVCSSSCFGTHTHSITTFYPLAQHQKSLHSSLSVLQRALHFVHHVPERRGRKWSQAEADVNCPLIYAPFPHPHLMRPSMYIQGLSFLKRVACIHRDAHSGLNGSSPIKDHLPLLLIAKPTIPNAAHACLFNSHPTAFFHPHPTSAAQPLGMWFFQRWLLKPVVTCAIDKQATSAAPRLPPPVFCFSACSPYTPFKPHPFRPPSFI